MIPCINPEMEARLAALLEQSVTDLRPDSLVSREFTLLAAHEPAARSLGIEFTGGPDLTVVVTDPSRRLGNIRVQTGGKNSVMFFDNATWGGNFVANIRMLGTDCVAFFNDIGDGFVVIEELLMRSHGQLLFWGTGTTAVGISMEIEGLDRSFVIGDDGLISNGVWVRNYDMHSVHDLRSGAQINRPAEDTVIERHVWLGQDALLLSCLRVGMGGIIGARCLLKGKTPPRVAVAGTPARVVRDGVSWGRHPYGMTAAERRSIGLSELPDA
jgi:hypothetical protein